MTSNRKKIAIFTGNRAEYGLQYSIIRAIADHPDLEYYLLASGAHLQEDFGNTKDEIKKDGIEVYGEVRIDFPEDTLSGTVHAIGSGILNMKTILDRLRPDMLIVYADRFEGFAAVISGTQMGIPTAHIEGGDITEGGALDDSVRHAMTKLSHLHFTTNEQASHRIVKMGEEPWRVHNVGFPVIDLIVEGNYATYEELKNRFALDIEKPVVIFTQHSVTTEFDKASEQIEPALEAMRLLSEEGIQVIITYPNNDAGGKVIIERIERLNSLNLRNLKVYPSVGRYFYHGILNYCGRKGVCVGNSSSGIKETPAFGCPAVNVGSRQKGRLRAKNVIDTDYDTNEILLSIKKALFDHEFRKVCASCENPYGTGGTGEKVARILAETKINLALLQKKMTY